MDPEKGSPCAGCVEKWLKQRQVWCEPTDLAELRVKRELIADLLAENSAHVFYEIMNDGSHTRLDGVVFPHPACQCQRSRYIAPEAWTKKTNFAFSPIYQLRCSRFGTPEGNLWLSCAVGDAPLSGNRLTAFGVATEREASRFQAVEEWMKRAALTDMKLRASGEESFAAETLQTGESRVLGVDAIRRLNADSIGIGATRDEATLDALYGLAKARTLGKYAASMKNPMLIVGANNWIRGKVPFFLLQQYDLHLLFYPNAMPAWVVGLAAFSRQKSTEPPVFVFGASNEIGTALDQAIHKVLEVCRPADLALEEDTMRPAPDPEKAGNTMKLNMWWTHWIYRCPKISLRDVLHLEPYKRELGPWREFFKDGEPSVSMLGLNHDCLPIGLKHVVKLEMPAQTFSNVRNVNGIGTWAAFRDQLA